MTIFMRRESESERCEDALNGDRPKYRDRTMYHSNSRSRKETKRRKLHSPYRPSRMGNVPSPAFFPSAKVSEQQLLSTRVLQTTSHLTFSPHTPFTGLKYIAGVDISFIKNTNKACAMLAILNFPDLTLAHKTYDIVEMTEPYIPFFLAFREVGHLFKLFERVKIQRPEMYPQIVFVDGAGVWHPKGSCPPRRTKG